MNNIQIIIAFIGIFLGFIDLCFFGLARKIHKTLSIEQKKPWYGYIPFFGGMYYYYAMKLEEKDE